ncbi:hypothetical protein C8J56DRAFT_1023768 [Mycena floridula]|nr:hypothetical protein C8J56DRAFT_1023768 [Mycena floridula]
MKSLRYTPKRDLDAAAPRPPKEYTFECCRKQKPWAKLSAFGSLVNATILPEDPTVSGSVTLDLATSEVLQAVIMTASLRELLLDYVLEITKTLWDSSMGHPLGSSLSPGFGGKLRGKFTRPFEIELPKEIVLAVGTPAANKSFRLPLPQTFLERNSHLVYQEASPLLPLKSDQEGWHMLNPMQSSAGFAINFGCHTAQARSRTLRRSSYIGISSVKALKDLKPSSAMGRYLLEAPAFEAMGN